jgi:tRNA (guanine37-N1)-methyltransferase
MRVHVVTLFPELFSAFVETSVVKKAIQTEALDFRVVPLRVHGLGKHRSVDDTPYGGGAGMVLRVDCIVSAIESAEEGSGRSHRVLLTPQGERFHQAMVPALISKPALTLVCGRYEGFDERVRAFVDQELSLGDFVLAGGETAAMAVIECAVRFLPGILGNEASVAEESFAPGNEGYLEYPQYTRPQSYRGMDIPEVLASGDHARIAAWRREQALERTRKRRPDLLRATERR